MEIGMDKSSIHVHLSVICGDQQWIKSGVVLRACELKSL